MSYLPIDVCKQLAKTGFCDAKLGYYLFQGSGPFIELFDQQEYKKIVEGDVDYCQGEIEWYPCPSSDELKDALEQRGIRLYYVYESPRNSRSKPHIVVNATSKNSGKFIAWTVADSLSEAFAKLFITIFGKEM